jgi:ADP-ribose pyrophosphatase
MGTSGSPQPWELQSSEHLQDYDVYRVRRDRVRSPRDGSLHDFHVVDAPDGVTVLALTPEHELVLVEQYRHGIRQLSLETPSGILEEGEDPLDAALRELEEETGFRAEEPRSLGTLDLNPSWETTRVHVVLATGARRAGDEDPGEDTRVRCVATDEVRERVREGAIRSATVVAALHLFWAAGGGAGVATGAR